MSEEIEYFKRFASAYMRWTHFNFDRIVADVIRKDKEAEERRKEELRTKPYRDQIKSLLTGSNLYFNKIASDIMKENLLMQGSQWPTGQILKIRMPADYQLSKVKF